jgi:hypothetical protein
MTALTVLRALRHRTAGFLVAVGLLWGGWEAFLAASAPGRIDTALRRALEGQPVVDVAVSLDFAPEDFHIRLFQTHGTVSGVRGTTVLINRVRTDDVWRIARHYWVRRIAPQ